MATSFPGVFTRLIQDGKRLIEEGLKMAGLLCCGCGTEFGFFRREHSCKYCGQIFCSYCTSHSIVLPHQGTKKHKVCDKCYQKLTRTCISQQSSNQLSGNNEQNDLNQVSQSKLVNTARGNEALPRNIVVDGRVTDPNEEIRQRLLQLRHGKDNENSSNLSDETLGKRFEELTGRKAVSMQTYNVLTPQLRKTETEETMDLLKQVTDECAIDGGPSSAYIADIPERSEQDETDALIKRTMAECKIDQAAATTPSLADEEIETRLAKLKGIDPSVYRMPVSTDFDSEDEEEATKQYLRQVLDEAVLERKTESIGYDPTAVGNTNKSTQPKCSTKSGKEKVKKAVDKPSSIFNKEYEVDDDDDELPWCCICNGNADVRCHGCDDDLYCRRCYREGHSKDDYEEHEVSVFRPKRSKPRS